MAISIAEYEKALRSLEEAIQFSKANTANETQFKIARDACIQRFEFCVELAWKTSAKVLGSSSTTSKPVIREMAQNGMIADLGIWFDFIEARNKSSHTYDEKAAVEVFQVAQEFVRHGQDLLTKIRNK